MDVQRSIGLMGHTAWDWSADTGTRFQLVWAPGMTALMFGAKAKDGTEWATTMVMNEDYAVPADAKLADVQAIVDRWLGDLGPAFKGMDS